MIDKQDKISRSEEGCASDGKFPISNGEIGNRIDDVAKTVGGNSSLARLCNVSPSVIGNWISGRAEPPTRNLIAIARVGGVTVEWLATGLGPRDPAHAMNIEQFLKIPFYDSRLVTGCNALFDGGLAEESIILPMRWPADNAGTASTELSFTRMNGDALSPTLRDGQLLLVDRSVEVVGEGIYVFFIDGFMFIQRLTRRPGEPIYYLDSDLSKPPSLLPKFEDYEERSGIVGRVIWAGGKL